MGVGAGGSLGWVAQCMILLLVDDAVCIACLEFPRRLHGLPALELGEQALVDDDVPDARRSLGRDEEVAGAADVGILLPDADDAPLEIDMFPA